MKLDRGERIPGLEDVQFFTKGEPSELTVSEICENELERLYEESWVYDLFREIDATDIEGDKYNVEMQTAYYNGGSGMVEIDKFARGTNLVKGWGNGWLKKLIRSIEDAVREQIRGNVKVIDDPGMTIEDTEEHFNDEYGFHNAECFEIGNGLYLYASPDVFGYDIVRREFTVDHWHEFRFKDNYAIASTRRGFSINADAVLYDI